jgi:hypothetical protein
MNNTKVSLKRQVEIYNELTILVESFLDRYSADEREIVLKAMTDLLKSKAQA